jgi:hypothetical protein
MGLMTRTQLNVALAMQGRRAPKPYLGSLLVELGLLSNKDLGRVLTEQANLLTKASRVERLPTHRAEEKRFGRIATACRFITPAQLIEALEIQKRSSPKPLLGAVLVELGYLTFRQVRQVLGEQGIGGGTGRR